MSIFSLKKISRSIANSLFLFTISQTALAVVPANVVVLIDQNEPNREQTIELLYSQTWTMLDGIFDVRFATPRLEKTADIYADDNFDLVIAIGNPGINVVKAHEDINKPTFLLKAGKGGVDDLSNQYVQPILKTSQETQKSYIQRIVTSMRARLSQL